MFHGILYGNLDQHGREIDRVRVKGRIDIPCQMEVRPQRLRLQVQIRTHEPQLLPQRNTELLRDLQATNIVLNDAILRLILISTPKIARGSEVILQVLITDHYHLGIYAYRIRVTPQQLISQPGVPLF